VGLDWGYSIGVLDCKAISLPYFNDTKSYAPKSSNPTLIF